MPFDILTVSQLVIERIAAIQTVTPRLLVVIDGLGGAGKSSLARAIAAEFPGARAFEYDWFHLPKAQATASHRFDHQRLIDEVVIPLRRGARGFECRRYNWGYLAGKPDGFASEPVRINDVDVLVLEGCGVLARALCDLYDLRIWVNTSTQEAVARGMRRDIEEYGLDPGRVRSAWAEWSEWEAQSLANDDRRLRADLMV